jgi:hypothetical protein
MYQCAPQGDCRELGWVSSVICVQVVKHCLTESNSDYYPNMEDFFIKQILGVQAGNDTYWSLWLNFKYVTVGGCQAQIKSHDSVLWALIPSRFDPCGGTRNIYVYGRLAHCRNSLPIVYSVKTQGSSNCEEKRSHFHHSH